MKCLRGPEEAMKISILIAWISYQMVNIVLGRKKTNQWESLPRKRKYQSGDKIANLDHGLWRSLVGSGL